MRPTTKTKRPTDAQLQQLVSYGVVPLKEQCKEFGLTSGELTEFMADAEAVAELRARLARLYLTELRKKKISAQQVGWTAHCTIAVGTCVDARSMYHMIANGYCDIEAPAARLLSMIDYSTEAHKVDLVFATSEDLHLDAEWNTGEKILTAALNEGLEMCEPEDGPYLADQYREIPSGRIIKVFRPLHMGRSRVMFEVLRDYQGRRLDVTMGSLKERYADSDVFAFRLPAG